MDTYWTTATGDELRIADVDTQHPRLQTSSRAEGWRDCSPKLYPLCLFALAVQLIGVLDEADLLKSEAVIDCGIQIEEP